MTRISLSGLSSRAAWMIPSISSLIRRMGPTILAISRSLPALVGPLDRDLAERLDDRFTDGDVVRHRGAFERDLVLGALALEEALADHQVGDLLDRLRDRVRGLEYHQVGDVVALEPGVDRDHLNLVAHCRLPLLNRGAGSVELGVTELGVDAARVPEGRDVVDLARRVHVEPEQVSFAELL